LDEIAEGKIKWKKLLESFWKPFKQNVDGMSELRITDVLEALDKILFEEIFVSQDKTCPGCKSGNLALRIGKYGAFYSCERYPDCGFVMKLNSNENPEDLAEESHTQKNEPIAHDKLNAPIYLKKGPYGWYLQVGENAKEPGFKRVTLPPNIKPQDVDQEIALKVTALPRLVGEDADGNEIVAAIGRFGPYLKYKQKLFSLPKDENPFTIDVEKSLQVIKNKEERDAKNPKKINKFATIKEEKETVEKEVVKKKSVKKEPIKKEAVKKETEATVKKSRKASKEKESTN
jgi:DNA topoisomerase-1